MLYFESENELKFYNLEAWSHTSVDIHHMVIIRPSADSFKKGCYKLKYVHKLLVNRLLKLVWREKMWLDELTVPT